jgi:hypothetical protein
MITSATIGRKKSESSLRFRSVYPIIDRILRLPKKIRLNVQSIYTAPRTILVAAKKVAQKF